MKKLAIAFLVVMFLGALTSIVLADDTASAYFKIGQAEFVYPLSNASVISLYDYWKGEGLIGAESSLVKYQRLNLNFGAVTSFIANGMPFVSLDFDWCGLITNSSQTKLARVGIWFGKDFKNNDNRAGIKASIPVW